MISVHLKKIEHKVKVGDKCNLIQPNVKEDTLFLEDGIPVGFYIRDVSKYSDKLTDFLAIANSEFQSKRVPKAMMARSSAMVARRVGGKGVQQFSTIIGSVPPKPHMRRAYPTVSSVHASKTAQPFIKAMLLACREAENLVKLIMPDAYENQIKIIKQKVPEQWQFGRLFTSSISNFNIAAAYHIDNANLKGCLNVILTKRQNSMGGNLNVPDYGLTFDSCDNSLIVYPAWKSVHGVTPIVPTADGGYRNSLIFYPLKAFSKLIDSNGGA